MKVDAMRVVRALGSRQLATTTMIAWAALIIVWVIPFQIYGLPTFQIKNIVYSESFFRIVYALLALNTLACVLPRVGAVARRAGRKLEPDASPRVPDESITLHGDWDGPKAVRALRSSGFRHVVEGDGWTWGVRNRYSPVGNLLFHLAFFVVIAGALLTLDPRSTYLGKAVVAEGESFNTATGTFSEEPVPRDTRPGVSFRLESLRPTFYRDILLFTGLDGVLSSGGRTHKIALSSPWIESPTTQVAIEDFGYVFDTRWVVDEVGDIAKSYKLKVFPSGLADSFVLNQGGKIDYEVTARVYGDYIDRGGKPGSRSFNLRDPRIQLDVSRILSSGGRQPVVTGVLVQPGESVSLPDSTFTVEKIGHYGVFRIFDSWAAPVIFIGVVMLLGGAALRLLFPRQDALIISSGDAVRLSVRDEAYRTALSRVRTIENCWDEPEDDPTGRAS